MVLLLETTFKEENLQIVEHYLGIIFNSKMFVSIQGVSKLLSKRILFILLALINPTWIDKTPSTKN